MERRWNTATADALPMGPAEPKSVGTECEMGGNARPTKRVWALHSLRLLGRGFGRLSRRFSSQRSKRGQHTGQRNKQRDESGRDCDVYNRSEEHTSELQSRGHLVCRLLLEKKKLIR